MGFSGLGFRVRVWGLGLGSWVEAGGKDAVPSTSSISTVEHIAVEA